MTLQDRSWHRRSRHRQLQLASGTLLSRSNCRFFMESYIFPDSWHWSRSIRGRNLGHSCYVAAACVRLPLGKRLSWWCWWSASLALSCSDAFVSGSGLSAGPS